MEKTVKMCKKTGYMSMINIPVWMFLSSYEKLRESLIAQDTFANMVHFGRGVFGSDFGTTAFVIAKAHINGYKGTYCRLFEKQGAVDSVETKEKWFLEGMGRFVADQSNFSKIPGSPVAYWVSDGLLKAFEAGISLGTIARPRIGQNTGDNNRFLRLWFEVGFAQITFGLKHDDLQVLRYKWIPYNKGGEYRRWYGNQEYLINWERDGAEIKDYAVVRNHGKHWSRYIQNIENMCKPGITWSFVTSGTFAVRYLPEGFICDVAGSAIFPEEKNIYELTALCNTKFAMYILQMLNPTINMQAGNVASIPVLQAVIANKPIEDETKKCIELSKMDWNYYETSWDFKRNPLV